MPNFKVGLSPSKKNYSTCFDESPLKMMKMLSISFLKNFFRSQDIQFFTFAFWLCRRKDLIRKIRLVSKFMTLQPG